MAWKFYGRKGNLSRFRDIMKNPGFSAVQVRGRRRAGKTSFLKKAFHDHGGRMPVMVEIPEPDGTGKCLSGA